MAGSQDISHQETKFFSGAILGGSIGIAAGGAGPETSRLAERRGCRVWRSAADEGLFWETVNYAALKKLPLLFVCENNGYATYSPQASRQPRDNLSEKVAAFGVPSRDVFGNDVAAVYRTLAETLPALCAGQGPAFLQTYTYRWNSHVGPEDDSFVGYRPAAELEFWKRNCPILLLEERMAAEGLLPSGMKERIVAEIETEIGAAFEFARKSPFPEVPDWAVLNEAPYSPLADRLVAEITMEAFDGHRKQTRPGPY